MKTHAYDFSSLYPSAAKLERTDVSASKENLSRPWTAKKNKRTPLEAETELTEPQARSKVKTKKKNKVKNFPTTNVAETQDENSILSIGSSKKRKKENKSVSFVLDDVEVVTKKSKTTTSTNAEAVEAEESAARKIKKKSKKEKRAKKHSENVELTEVNEKQKKKKKSIDPAELEENLENMTIGENASTLADILDDMKVVNKYKKHKKTDKALENVKKTKKNKIIIAENTENVQELEGVEITKKTKKKKRRDRDESSASTEAAPAGGATEDSGEEAAKEKVKWNKRKWNRERRGGGAESSDELRTSVVVQNLPVSLLLKYKKLLAEHFAKCGLIKRIGIAEFYPASEPRTIFTTTVHFYSEDAADQALEEDNMELSGSRMSLRRPLPATDTTVAVRCYAGCSPHLLSSIFASCGRVRCIREIQKGRSSMPTAFVEFDGPEAVERALGVMGEARIGGKKVLVNRFEDRGAHKHRRADSEGDTDSKAHKETDRQDS